LALTTLTKEKYRLTQGAKNDVQLHKQGFLRTCLSQYRLRHIDKNDVQLYIIMYMDSEIEISSQVSTERIQLCYVFDVVAEMSILELTTLTRERYRLTQGAKDDVQLHKQAFLRTCLSQYRLRHHDKDDVQL